MILFNYFCIQPKYFMRIIRQIIIISSPKAINPNIILFQKTNRKYTFRKMRNILNPILGSKLIPLTLIKTLSARGNASNSIDWPSNRNKPMSLSLINHIRYPLDCIILSIYNKCFPAKDCLLLPSVVNHYCFLSATSWD